MAAGAALLTLAACGGAAELSVARTHHSLPGNWNEVHPSIRYERNGVMAAAYRNSEGNLTAAAGAVWRGAAWRGCAPFAEAGLATGYRAALVVPMARAGAECAAVRAFVFPEYVIDHGAAAGVGVETILMRF